MATLYILVYVYFFSIKIKSSIDPILQHSNYPETPKINNQNIDNPPQQIDMNISVYSVINQKLLPPSQTSLIEEFEV